MKLKIIPFIAGLILFSFYLSLVLPNLAYLSYFEGLVLVSYVCFVLFLLFTATNILKNL